MPCLPVGRFMAIDKILIENAFIVYAPALSQFRALLMAASYGYHLFSSLSKYMYMVPSGLAGLGQKLMLRLSSPSGHSPTHHFPLAHSMCVSRGSHTIF
jgi:hypothetical protein